MSVAPNAPYERPPTSAPGQDRRPRTERDDRIETGIMTGTRVASTDITVNAGWFVKVPHGLFNVLCQANALSGTHYRYLLMLYEHSHGFQSDYAIISLRDRRPPAMAHWCSWLGKISTKQVYQIRRELHQRHLIAFPNQDSACVAFNMQWETWDQSVFERQASRRQPRITATATPPTDMANDPEAVFLGDPQVSCNVLAGKNEEAANNQEVSCSLPADGSEPSPEAASDDSLENVTRGTQEETNALASGATRTPDAPAPFPDDGAAVSNDEGQPRTRQRSSRTKTPRSSRTIPPQFRTSPPSRRARCPRGWMGKRRGPIGCDCITRLRGIPATSSTWRIAAPTPSWALR